MRMLLKKSKKLLLLVLALCVLVTCKSDIVFASNAEGDAQIELVYDLNTSSFNIGNDTDGDGVVDDFGDKDADGRIMPSTMYNNWTDQTATKFIPFHETSKDDTSTPNERKEKVWARGRTRTWQLYLGYIDEKYITTYDYKNDNTMPWAWTSYYEVLDATQTFTTYTFSTAGASQGGYLQVRTNTKAAFGDGGEPYYTLKLKVPTAGTYDVSVETTANSSKNANLYFYMLSASSEASTRDELMNEANLLGNMYSGEKTSTTLDKTITVSAPGEYYFVVKIDDDKNVPTAKWDIQLKSITLNGTPIAEVAEVAEVNGTKYATLQDAISNATTNDTIKLLGDIEYTETLTIANGITLDLNGKKLTASNVAALGGKVADNSQEKTGVLKVDSDKCAFSTNNGQMPVYNGEDGYVFTTITPQELNNSVTGTNTFELVFKPLFGETINALLANSQVDTQISFRIRLDWKKAGVPMTPVYLEYTDDMVQQVYGNSMAFSIKAFGVNNYEDLTITPMVISDKGVEWTNGSFDDFE